LASRNISKPVEALSDAAKKSWPGRSYRHVAVSRPNDELGMLTNVFNNMVADLSGLQQQLKKYKRCFVCHQ
jgi:nitrogen fixation/metabolism regulation signal transduction histidine kinase